jgi:tRNA (adenine57-N1/adenine58-N1)-methyltransferase
MEVEKRSPRQDPIEEEAPTKKTKQLEVVDPKNFLLMKEGDRVIVHLRDDDMRVITLTHNTTLDCKYGIYPHSFFMGKPFGSKILNSKGTGYVYGFKWNPLLWTLSLPHRTQILYTEDISMIVMYLNLTGNTRVVESGTGSGSLSHNILQRIMPHGHLYTFEFHKERFEKAQIEFIENGFEKFVTATHRDVLAEGFKLKGEDTLDNSIDAVFLDLPKPQDCIGHVSKVLVKNGKVCSFSPCIEQVQETCEKLALAGYTDLKTIECLAKNYQLRRQSDKDYIVPVEEMAGHTGYLTFARRN